MKPSTKMSSPRDVNLNTDSLREVESTKRLAYAPLTCCGTAEKILAALFAALLMGGIAASIAAPILLIKGSATPTSTVTSTTTSTTSTTSTTVTTSTTTTTTTTATTTTTTSTRTSTTSTTATTSTTTTTTTTQRLPVSRTAIVTASGFDPGSGTPTVQQNSLVDRTVGGGGMNSGGYPPQYVQLELLGFYNVTFVSLNIGQAPNGATIHQMRVGPTTGALTLVTTLNGVTSAGQWINITYNPPLTNVKFLRIDTTSSPSWVAWVKFIVYDY